MEEKCKFSYSDFDDSLIISCRDESYQYSENNMEEVGENFSFDDIVLNITKNGKIQVIIINNSSQLIQYRLVRYLNENLNPNEHRYLDPLTHDSLEALIPYKFFHLE